MKDIWIFWFITLWIVLCAGKPDILDAIAQRVAGSTCTQDTYSSHTKELELSLAVHKARENALVKVLHFNKIITDKEFYEMTAKSME